MDHWKAFVFMLNDEDIEVITYNQVPADLSQ